MSGKKKKLLFVEWCADDALGGTLHMEPMVELAYRRIIDMIYSTKDKLKDSPTLRHGTKTGNRWEKIKQELIDMEKIYVENGYIRNKKCSEKLKKSAENINQKSEAGIASAEARKQKGKLLKNNKAGSTAVDIPVTPAVITGGSTARATNQEPNNQEIVVDVDNARESENPKLKLFAEISERVQEAIKPLVPINTQRVHAWLDAGADGDLIIETITVLMARRNGQPVSSLRYFESAIATAIQEKTKPLKMEKAHETDRASDTKNHNVPARNGFYSRKTAGHATAELLAAVDQGKF